MERTAHSLAMTDEIKGSRVFRLLRDAETVCFVGDSLTEGTLNGGIPWYDPIRPWIHGKIVNISQGGATTKILLDYFLPSIVRATADLFVVAAGANDILFRDPMFCAVTATDYIRNLQSLRDAIRARRPDASFCFIAPWIATDGNADLIGGVKLPGTDEAYGDYTAALKSWCAGTGDICIDANGYIARRFVASSPETYLVDFIHPNADSGVLLYAEAVLLSEASAPPTGGEAG